MALRSSQHRSWSIASVVASAVVVATSGCDLVLGLTLPPPDATCDLDEDCVEAGVQGRCECGACALPDASCPVTNRRWIGIAAPHLANTCVPAIEHVDARVYHTCATMTDHRGWCWGNNAHGQLGAGQPVGTHANSPIEVRDAAGPLVELAELQAGGFSTCARRTDGTVACWGSNQYGQLGAGLPTGTDERSIDPVVVRTADGVLTNVTSLSVGFYHACALVERLGLPDEPFSDEIYCWGNNDHGQVGAPVFEPQPVAVRVVGLPAGDLQAVAAGGEHTCAIVLQPDMGQANVGCWGRAWDGRLGNNTPIEMDGRQPFPQLVLWSETEPLPAAVSLAAGNRYTCVIRRPNGEVFCWGRNERGQLGDGTQESRAIATPVPELALDPMLLAAGDTSTCSTIGTNTMCWGADANGELGDGPDDGATELVPVTAIPGQRQHALTAGFRYACAVDGDRQLRCWGANQHGALGLGDLTDRHSPTEVPRAAFCPAP